MATIESLANNLSQWSQATFGPDNVRGPIGPLRHLEKEVQEALAAPGDIMEYADCLTILMDAARRAGFSIQQLIDASNDKIEFNKTRLWPRPTSDEPVFHIKG